MKTDDDILDELGEVAVVNTDEIERDLWQQVNCGQRHDWFSRKGSIN